MATVFETSIEAWSHLENQQPVLVDNQLWWQREKPEWKTKISQVKDKVWHAFSAWWSWDPFSAVEITQTISSVDCNGRGELTGYDLKTILLGSSNRCSVTTWWGGVGWGGVGWEKGGRFKREGTFVYLWSIHADVWQKPTQCCKAIILQLETHF